MHMTYTGSCLFNGTQYMCSSMSSVLDQKVSFYDHVLGLEDKITAGTAGGSSGFSDAKKGVNPTPSTSGNIQKKIYRYSPAIARASFSGPVPSVGFGDLLSAAINGTDVITEMTFWNQSALQVKVSKAKVSSLSISLKAGDVSHFSAEVVGAQYDATSGDAPAAACAKLLTWDVCTVLASTVSSDIASFDLTISNPTIPIYTAKWTTDTYTNGMMPQKIRLGMQEVTGTIGIYGPTLTPSNTVGTVKFDLNGVGKTLNCIFTTPTDNGSGGPYVRTISFVGANDTSAWS